MLMAASRCVCVTPMAASNDEAMPGTPDAGDGTETRTTHEHLTLAQEKPNA